jgi:hypothetical protein
MEREHTFSVWLAFLRQKSVIKKSETKPGQSVQPNYPLIDARMRAKESYRKDYLLFRHESFAYRLKQLWSSSQFMMNLKLDQICVALNWPVLEKSQCDQQATIGLCSTMYVLINWLAPVPITTVLYRSHDKPSIHRRWEGFGQIISLIDRLLWDSCYFLKIN